MNGLIWILFLIILVFYNFYWIINHKKIKIKNSKKLKLLLHHFFLFFFLPFFMYTFFNNPIPLTLFILYYKTPSTFCTIPSDIFFNSIFILSFTNLYFILNTYSKPFSFNLSLLFSRRISSNDFTFLLLCVYTLLLFNPDNPYYFIPYSPF